MTYTINGKPYTEFDINKRCAELIGISVRRMKTALGISLMYMGEGHGGYKPYDPCTNPSDAWPIIEKYWDKLMSVKFEYYGALTMWQYLRHEHKCTKLLAACICYIEINEGKL